ncbi:nitrite reductase large subunit NirB [Cohnella faecalis]|uniref:NAD(P)/FAD-dependent oxidoreductase n=1 Tax=Cohnella faecalis TaxID=2315694 RepID=A0A398CJ81_9BACL|nr:nitrite reductase large subunit NirB [Cohnella faecalis]RIE02172.1 NAD(P)/FAD-dependent oxidoreductase [Cohnella faecalis]
MSKQKLVLVGNGMAGVRCVEEILKLSPDAFDITIFGSEPHPNYNRIMLSKVLQGDTKVEDITINDRKWYSDNGIALFTGETVTHIDTEQRRVVSDSGRSVPYDKLILATGSLPFMLPLPGADKPGVTAFRDINDCNKMMAASRKYKNAVVIGGGLLGLEAARGLLNLGMSVHVVHIYKHLMERQLTPTSAQMLKTELERQGMRFLLEKQTEMVLGKKRVEGLLFKDGTKVAADLVVIAVGVRPHVQLAKDGGIEVNRAIVVDDRMRTSVPGVYAVGECAEHRGMVYGLVAPLYEQGKVLAKEICKMDTEGYAGSILYSQLKVSGVEVFSAGEIRDSEAETALKIYDGKRLTYKKVTMRDGKIVGAVLYGDSSEGNKLLSYIKQGADVSVLEEPVSASGSSEEERIAAMPDKETVCSCNGVTKGAIMEAIRCDGLQTFEEVRACTKASSSCGGCKPLVSGILAYTLAHPDAASEKPKEAVCGCTTMDHEELKTALRGGAYRSVSEAMAGLGWARADGCPICKPAVRYYLGGIAVAEPGAEARAVTPRMYGGVTNAEQLRRIADVIDKYDIPLVKLGSSSLDLLGVAGPFSELIDAELGMPYAQNTYGHAVSSVGTCAGLSFDGQAMQDSVGMGARLEKRLQAMQMPAAFSAAVSASPLHRAGTLAKDLGIVGTPGGWEVYVGGSGTDFVREGQLLYSESDPDAVLDVASAFAQWYGEDARYRETTAQWIERVGLIPIRESLFQRDVREELLARIKLDHQQATAVTVGQ